MGPYLAKYNFHSITKNLPHVVYHHFEIQFI